MRVLIALLLVVLLTSSCLSKEAEGNVQTQPEIAHSLEKHTFFYVTEIFPRKWPVPLKNEKLPEEGGAEIQYYTEDEVTMLAKLLYNECRGVPSDTEKACVAWTVCNRVDSSGFAGDTISEVLTYPNAFAYYENTPVLDNLYELAQDVLSRWNAERNGQESVGRVLPADYTYFSGDGTHNYFRNAYDGNYKIWDYSLQSPYES